MLSIWTSLKIYCLVNSSIKMISYWCVGPQNPRLFNYYGSEGGIEVLYLANYVAVLCFKPMKKKLLKHCWLPACFQPNFRWTFFVSMLIRLVQEILIPRKFWGLWASLFPPWYIIKSLKILCLEIALLISTKFHVKVSWVNFDQISLRNFDLLRNMGFLG